MKKKEFLFDSFLLLFFKLKREPMATEKEEEAKRKLKIQVDKIINDSKSKELKKLFDELKKYKSPIDEVFIKKLENLVNKVLAKIHGEAPIPKGGVKVLGDIVTDIILEEIFPSKQQESSAQSESTSPLKGKVTLESDSNVYAIPTVENDRTV